MFCPTCSQQQTSDGVSFCPGCGFQLSFVSELVANNGALATRAAEARQNVSLLRRKGVRIGAKLVFLSVFLLPLAFIFSVRFDSPIPFMAPFIAFLMGLAQVLYTLLFEEHDQSELPEPQRAGLSAANRVSLLAVQTTPIPINNSRQVNTAKMVRPSSVTEHTTQLLDDSH
jgi:hypothetical protein